MLILLGISSLLFAQKEAPDIRHGNRDYNKDNFAEAEVDYRRGLEKNNQSYEAHYNLGDALFRQNKYPEAAEEFIKAAQVIDPKKDKQKAAKTYHNLGNSLFAQQQYDKAITAYQQSLRANPKDNDTRYNMVKAMQMLQQQQQALVTVMFPAIHSGTTRRATKQQLTTTSQL
jgi:tetratricopeptide (TPR) repeat protein